MPAKEIVSAADAVTPTVVASEEAATVETAPEPVIEKVWEFVKNINTFEEIPLADGRTYKFAQSYLVTADRKLAEHLIAVASRYAIIHNNP